MTQILADLPGTFVTWINRRVPGEVPTDTGVAFMIETAERGPTGVAVEVNTLAEFTSIFGPRMSNSTLYDSVDLFTREGGTRAMVSRVTAAAATVASRTLNDRAVTPLPTLRVEAKGKGTYGNLLSITVTNGVTGNTFVIKVTEAGVIVEESPELASPSAAVAWGVNAATVNVVDLASVSASPTNNAAVSGITAMTGGTTGTVAESDWTAALTAFNVTLGPGQVLAPGRTVAATHLTLVAHAQANNRTAFLDVTDTATVATLKAAVTAIRNSTADPAAAGLFGPPVIGPGLTRNTTRTFPASVFAAALAARSDRVTGHANRAAAGDNGRAVYATTVTRSFTDTERADLNAGGFNLVKMDFGNLEIFGWRTAVDPNVSPEWLELSHRRFRTQLTAQAVRIGNRYEFSVIDGRGALYSRFAKDLIGMLLGYYELDALYGPTPEQAFRVDVGPPVNTNATAAARILRAQCSVIMSPFAEQVQIDFAKFIVGETFAG